MNDQRFSNPFVERLSNGLTREETVRLHNEVNTGGLPPCECPVCRAEDAADRDAETGRGGYYSGAATPAYLARAAALKTST